MRQMSFSLTTNQVEAGNKDVTRRMGWANLKPGQLLQAIEKGQGLKRGEKVKKICVIEVVKVHSEHVAALTDGRYYSKADAALEMVREGFPHLCPGQFVELFCKANRCEPSTQINRIEFKYV